MTPTFTFIDTILGSHSKPAQVFLSLAMVSTHLIAVISSKNPAILSKKLINLSISHKCRL